MICKNETEECQYRGKEIISGYENSNLDKLNDYCMKVCKNLNSAYWHIEESLHEKFNLKIRKYVRTSGNGENARNIFIFQLKTVSFNIWLYANLHIHPLYINPQQCYVVYATFTFNSPPPSTPRKKIWYVIKHQSA